MVNNNDKWNMLTGNINDRLTSNANVGETSVTNVSATSASNGGTGGSGVVYKKFNKPKTRVINGVEYYDDGNLRVGSGGVVWSGNKKATRYYDPQEEVDYGATFGKDSQTYYDIRKIEDDYGFPMTEGAIAKYHGNYYVYDGKNWLPSSMSKVQGSYYAAKY